MLLQNRHTGKADGLTLHHLSSSLIKPARTGSHNREAEYDNTHLFVPVHPATLFPAPAGKTRTRSIVQRFKEVLQQNHAMYDESVMFFFYSSTTGWSNLNDLPSDRIGRAKDALSFKKGKNKKQYDLKLIVHCTRSPKLASEHNPETHLHHGTTDQ